MKALVWPAAMYGCESYTLGKNEETHLYAFEIKGLKFLTTWMTSWRPLSYFLDYYYCYYYYY